MKHEHAPANMTRRMLEGELNHQGPPCWRLKGALGFRMGAILPMPPEARAAHFSRELDRFVIEALRAVKRQGGDQAFNRTARDLVISVCAILAYERGTNAVVDLFNVIERELADD